MNEEITIVVQVDFRVEDKITIKFNTRMKIYIIYRIIQIEYSFFPLINARSSVQLLPYRAGDLFKFQADSRLARRFDKIYIQISFSHDASI